MKSSGITTNIVGNNIENSNKKLREDSIIFIKNKDPESQ